MVLDGPDPIQDQAGYDTKPGIGALEDQRARRVLPRRVPGADDEDEAGADAALEDALEGAQRDKLGKVVGEADAEDDDAPDDHVARQRPAHLVPLQHDVGRELEAHIRDVEDGRQPRVLLPREVGVIAEPERGLRAEGGLVRLLDAVAEPHEREEVAVHLPLEGLVLLICVLLCFRSCC